MKKTVERIIKKLDNERNEMLLDIPKEKKDLLSWAYEITIKEDFFTILNDIVKDLNEEELLILDSMENIVNNIYHEWLCNDYSYMEILEDTVNDFFDKHME